MKKSRLTLGVVLVALMIGAGCGDDDCPTCPQQTQLAVASGSVSLQGSEFFAYGDIIGLNGQEPDLDSILIGGLIATIGPSMSGSGFRHFQVYQASSDLVSGDTVNVKLYTPAGVSSAREKLLQNPEVVILLTSGFRAYDSAETATFVWNSSPKADWTCIETTFSYLDADEHQVSSRHRYIKAVDDTTLTVPGDSLAHSGWLSLQLEVGTGPDPNSTHGNLSGGSVRGNIASIHLMGYGMQVGAGLPMDRQAGLSESSENRHLQRMQEMIELYEE